MYFDARGDGSDFEEACDVFVGHLVVAAEEERGALEGVELGERGEDAGEFGFGVEFSFGGLSWRGGFGKRGLALFDSPVLDLQIADDGKEVASYGFELGGGGRGPEAEEGLRREVLGTGGIAGEVEREAIDVAAVPLVDVVKVGRWQTHIQSMELSGIRYKDF